MSSPGMSSPPFQLSRTCPFKAQHSSTPLGISWPSQSLVISPTSALAPSFVCSVLDLLTCVQLFVTPQTVALPAPQPMEFPRQEYWSGLPFPPLWDLPDPGIEPASPALTDKLFTPLCHLGSPKLRVTLTKQWCTLDAMWEMILRQHSVLLGRWDIWKHHWFDSWTININLFSILYCWLLLYVYVYLVTVSW